MSNVLQPPIHGVQSSAAESEVKTTQAERSGLERFVDNFFREENIKWMSVIGAAIVLGSSLMLVTHEWKNWPSEIKFLAILGYTVVLYGCAQLARIRFALQTTAKVLQLLTLLLIPLCFMALGWLQAAQLSTWSLMETVLLMTPAIAFMIFAGSRILHEILGGRQPTFAISYMLLSAAGVLPIFHSTTLASLFSIACWAIMTCGIVKVNRHLFWMAEEHKSPRVFGFFPIALLGSLFLSLVCMKTLQAIPFEWLGMGCVMVSATILLTTRSVAEVFRQRTGNLVRPLPWNIVVPLVIGLLVLTSGVLIFSFYGFSLHGPTTVAIVPTTLAAAVLLSVVAFDTGVSGFAWAGLLLLTIAYQTSPTLVTGLIQQLKQQASTALNESVLPFAFYGITYLPLIVIMMLASGLCDLRSRSRYDRLRVFSAPLRHFATALTIGLFAVAAFNLKAIALVSMLDVPLLLSMALLFKDRRYAYGSLACLVLACILVVPFTLAMEWFHGSIWLSYTVVASLALVLVATPVLDRWLQRIPERTKQPAAEQTAAVRPANAVCLIVGYTLAFVTSVAWTATMVMVFNLSDLGISEAIQLALLLSALAVSTARSRDYSSAVSFWLLGGVGAFTFLLNVALPWQVWVSCSTIGAACISVVGYLLVKHIYRRSPDETWQCVRQPAQASYLLNRSARQQPVDIGNQNRISGQAHVAATFVVSLSDLSLAMAVCLAFIFHLPQVYNTLVNGQALVTPLATAVIVLWSFAQARLFSSSAAGVIAAAVMPLTCSALVISYVPRLETLEWQALTCVVAAASLSLATAARTARPWSAVCLTSQLVIAVISTTSLLHAAPMFRMVGVVGVVGLVVGCLLHRTAFDRLRTTALAILGNLQLFMLVVGVSGVEGWFFQWIASPHLVTAITLLFPVLGISALIFDALACDTRYSKLDANLCEAWSTCLRSLLMGTIFLLMVSSHALLPWLTVILLGFCIFTMTEFAKAVRTQSEFYVVSGLIVLAMAGVWLARVGVFEIGVGVSQLMLASAALGGLLLTYVLRDHGRYGVFVRPMYWIGMTCPALLTAMAIIGELTNPSLSIDPINTLTMFCAAAIYFHQGLVRKERRYVVFALAIMNIAFGLTWRGLGIADAQFYCVPLGLSLIGLVQLLRSELPISARNPLRYVGALIMLVSPVFQIIEGSWLHLFSLLALCVLVILLAIGLRLRALIHTGTAFLLADLAMMVVRSTKDHPSFLWISGLGLGVAVIVLAAICERHREHLLSRIRLLDAELATWN